MNGQSTSVSTTPIKVVSKKPRVEVGGQSFNPGNQNSSVQVPVQYYSVGTGNKPTQLKQNSRIVNAQPPQVKQTTPQKRINTNVYFSEQGMPRTGPNTCRCVCEPSAAPSIVG